MGRIGISKAVILFLLMPCGTGSIHAAPILFLSTQLTPLSEAAAMRETILKGFSQPVDFEPYDRSVFNGMVSTLAARPSGSVVLGGLQQDFLHLYHAGSLASVEWILPRLTGRTFLPGLGGRRMFGSEGIYFIPWMQATYLMVASRRALRYLPPGADINSLSYDQLLAWAAAMYQATGTGRLGFPVGPSGLMARFVQGYLYPSFTGSMTSGFSGPEAPGMWRYLRDLWRYVAPSSTILNRMDNALLSGEVWVAWDHTARLLQAFKERPDDFVAFPAPAGPKGRGVLSVVAALGVPRGSELPASASLIEYLTRPSTQAQTMESVGFMPVVEVGGGILASKGLAALAKAVADQSASRDAVVNTVPLRSAEAARRFDLAYLVAFSRIVLRGMDVRTVLAQQEEVLLQAEALSPTEDTP